MPVQRIKDPENLMKVGHDLISNGGPITLTRYGEHVGITSAKVVDVERTK